MHIFNFVIAKQRGIITSEQIVEKNRYTYKNIFLKNPYSIPVQKKSFMKKEEYTTDLEVWGAVPEGHPWRARLLCGGRGRPLCGGRSSWRC